MGSQMEPRGGRLYFENRPWDGPRRSQDRLGSVLFSSCRSGSLFWSSWAPLGVVFGRLGLLLGSFLAAPGVVLVLFRHFNSSIQPVNSSTRRFNSSTHQPMALRHFLTRPGGLRAARLNPPPGPEGRENGVSEWSWEGPNPNCLSLICLMYCQFLWSSSQSVFQSLR